MIYYLLHHQYRSFWNLEAFSGTFQIKMMGTSNDPELIQCFCNLKQRQSFVCKKTKNVAISKIRAYLKTFKRHVIGFLNSHYIFELIYFCTCRELWLIVYSLFKGTWYHATILISCLWSGVAICSWIKGNKTFCWHGDFLQRTLSSTPVNGERKLLFTAFISSKLHS